MRFFPFYIIILLVVSCVVPARGEVFYTLEGAEISFDKIASSPKAVLFLWTTWCPYCRHALARLNEKPLSSKYNDIFFYYVDVGESKYVVEMYAKKSNLVKAIREKILLDAQGMLSERFHVMGIPTFIFLNNGQEIFRSYHFDEDMLGEVFRQ